MPRQPQHRGGGGWEQPDRDPDPDDELPTPPDAGQPGWEQPDRDPDPDDELPTPPDAGQPGRTPEDPSPEPGETRDDDTDGTTTTRDDATDPLRQGTGRPDPDGSAPDGMESSRRDASSADPTIGQRLTGALAASPPVIAGSLLADRAPSVSDPRPESEHSFWGSAADRAGDTEPAEQLQAATDTELRVPRDERDFWRTAGDGVGSGTQTATAALGIDTDGVSTQFDRGTDVATDALAGSPVVLAAGGTASAVDDALPSDAPIRNVAVPRDEEAFLAAAERDTLAAGDALATADRGDAVGGPIGAFPTGEDTRTTVPVGPGGAQPIQQLRRPPTPDDLTGATRSGPAGGGAVGSGGTGTARVSRQLDAETLLGAGAAAGVAQEGELPVREERDDGELSVPDDGTGVYDGAEIEPTGRQFNELPVPDEPTMRGGEIEIDDGSMDQFDDGEPIAQFEGTGLFRDGVEELDEHDDEQATAGGTVTIGDDVAVVDEGEIAEQLPDPEQPGPSVRERIERDDLIAPEREFPTGEEAVVGRETGERATDTDQPVTEPLDRLTAAQATDTATATRTTGRSEPIGAAVDDLETLDAGDGVGLSDPTADTTTELTVEDLTEPTADTSTTADLTVEQLTEPTADTTAELTVGEFAEPEATGVGMGFGSGGGMNVSPSTRSFSASPDHDRRRKDPLEFDVFDERRVRELEDPDFLGGEGIATGGDGGLDYDPFDDMDGFDDVLDW